MNFLGVFLGIGCIIGCMMLEGTHPGILLNLPAFLCVVGASFFACWVQFSVPVILGAIKCFFWIIAPARYNYVAQVELLVSMSTTARQQGLLALENSIGAANDDFTRDGIQMIVDGVDKDSLKAMMENAILVEEERLAQCAKFWESLGGFSPTMGIIGAVLGLIHAMSLLDRPDLLGPTIALAFVATIYGLILANLISIPASNRIKTLIGEQSLFKYMTLEGLMSIASSENTMMLKRRLSVYTGERSEV